MTISVGIRGLVIAIAADMSERAPSEAFFGGIVWTALLAPHGLPAASPTGARPVY